MIKLKDSSLQVSVLDALEALKSELVERDIDLLRDIKDGPSNVQITCPFHSNGQEKRPSMGVKKNGGICHCFTCGAVLEFSELVSYCINGTKSKQYGTNWLLNKYSDLALADIQDIFKFGNLNAKERDRLIARKCNGEPIDIDLKTGEKIGNQFVLESELDSYRWTHPYWAERGIVDNDIIEIFDLGYDREKKMITFPVRDIKGRCEFVAKRSVTDKFFQYPAGVSKPLYGLYELSELSKLHHNHWENSVLLCESMIDCILLWQSGHYALALNGLGNDRQFKQLKELPVRHIILATDNDDAGKKARERIKKYVTNKIFSEIIFPKDIKDIGECSREQIDNILEWEKKPWER